MNPNIPNIKITWGMLEKLLSVATEHETHCSGHVHMIYEDGRTAHVPFTKLHHHDLGVLVANKQSSPADIWTVGITDIG